MVKLRLKRFGRRHRPFYRLNAMDTRTPRNGRAIEELGTYDPLEKDASKAVQLKTERVNYWLGVGAMPSDTVRSLLKKAGLAVKDPPRRKTTAKPEASQPTPPAAS